MVKFGAHAFIWVGEWDTDNGNYAIEQASKVGFDFIEIPLLKPDEFNADSHRAALDAAGIDATCSLVLAAWHAHVQVSRRGAELMFRS